MVTGTIKLGAKKELSRKPLPGDQLEGFFYGGGVTLKLRNRLSRTENGKKLLIHRQHLILQTFNISPRAGGILIVLEGWVALERVVTQPSIFFYDNPSQKRVGVTQ